MRCAMVRARVFSPDILERARCVPIDAAVIPDADWLSSRSVMFNGFTFYSACQLPEEERFFRGLSKRELPVSCHMRPPESIDFSSLPDVAHDILGHALA